MTRAARLFCVVALIWNLGPALSEAASRVDVRARSVAPGELVVLTMTFDEAPSRVSVSVFNRDTEAFPLPDGRWQALVGIDLDQKPGTYTATIEAVAGASAGAMKETTSLVVRRRTFATRSLRVAPDFVNPPANELARIAGDSAFLRGVMAGSWAGRLWSEPFARPVPGQANSRFGTRSIYNGERRSPHGGTDFLSPEGTPIVTPNAGLVVCARDLYFTGNTVIVDHGLGVFSLLAHLSRLDVREGEMLAPGQVIGLVGATGRVTGPHLHWALTVRGARVDPLSLLTLLGKK